MAKKREIFKVDEDALKDMMASESISCGKSGTYISYDMYCRLARILPLLSDDMSVPAFLDNVLAHHLETYSEELGELFRRKTPKTF